MLMQPYQIVRTRRKTIALIVQSDGELLVRAPLHATDAQISAFVHQKAAWVREKQQMLRQRAAQSVVHRFQPGETFLFLGQSYPLATTRPAAPPFAFENERFLLSQAAQPQAEQLFIAWYKTQARRVFTERASHYAALTGWQYQRVRISSARTRWGSCSSRGALSFTWRLVMAPLPIVDYVVIHELAHLKHPNHSPHFWQAVQSILPDYPQSRQWLKTDGHQLRLE